MLGSINPLGERARRSNWGVTVAALLVGSLLAGSSVGVSLGALGMVLLGRSSTAVRAALAAAAVLAGTGLDLRLLRRRVDRLPGPRRQVDQDWLTSYRGWVYGLAFGVQLGLGAATIVTTAAVYATLAIAIVTASAGGGLLVGATFGLARALPVLAGASIRQPGDLLRLDAALRRWDGPARRMAIAMQAAVAVVAVGALSVR